MVAAHVPAAWAVAPPQQVLAARERAVDRMYRVLIGSPGLAEAAELAREAARAAGTGGRPLAGWERGPLLLPGTAAGRPADIRTSRAGQAGAIGRQLV